MSTPAGAPRRRKIAGERRPGRPVTAPEPVPTPGGASVGAQTAEPADVPPSFVRAPAPPATEAFAPPAPEPEASPVEEKPARATRVRRWGVRTPDWWGSTPVVVALAVLLFALLLAVGLGATGHLGNQSISEAHATRTDAAAWDASTAAPSVAERAAASILAYDYRDLSASEKEATQFMTSQYAKQYTTTFEKVVIPAAKQQKAKVTADVQASSVVRATPDMVRVLLYVDQTTVSAANTAPQVALNRVEMVMVRRSGTWLVDGISSY